MSRGGLGTAGPARRTGGLRDDITPTFGQRAVDRVTLAAGVVLGVTAVVVAHTVRGAWRSFVSAPRHR
ncbi:MAG: hypothetical protein ACRC35_12825 [Angustibacter sp.]